MRDYLDHAMRDTGRIELRHHDGDRWVSGLFDDIGALRMAIQQRAGRGNLFTTINAPRLMPCGNVMHARALTDADIVLHNRWCLTSTRSGPMGTPSTDYRIAGRRAGTRSFGLRVVGGWMATAFDSSLWQRCPRRLSLADEGVSRSRSTCWPRSTAG